MQTATPSKPFRGIRPERLTDVCILVRSAFFRKRNFRFFEMVPIEPHMSAGSTPETALETAVTGLDQWAADARHKLPILQARVSLRGGSTLTARDPQHELNLLESILENHARASREGVGKAELALLLDCIEHGIQHCAQYALDAGDDVALRACLDAMNDIDSRIQKLSIR